LLLEVEPVVVEALFVLPVVEGGGNPRLNTTDPRGEDNLEFSWDRLDTLFMLFWYLHYRY